MTKKQAEKSHTLPTPPTHEEILSTMSMLRPWHILTDPLIFGAENLPERGPALFVGNHTLMGLLDISIMMCYLYKEKNIFLRSLGDHGHFSIPLWRETMIRCGVVDGTRENCSQLMREGQFILVFPGGAREAFKRKDEKYKLFWDRRLGFARMAIKNNCPIVPFSAVGAEECLQILMDNQELQKTPLGLLLKKFHLPTDQIPPLVRGIGPTLLPRPSRFYFKFAPMISTHKFKGDFENEAHCRKLRDQVRRSVEGGLDEMLAFRENDPQRRLLPRLMEEIRESLEALGRQINMPVLESTNFQSEDLP